MMAKDDDRRGGGSVVADGQDAAPECTDTNRCEIVSGDELGRQRPGNGVRAFTPHAHACTAGLERRYLVELRCFGMSVNIAVVPPIPSASVRIAASVKTRDCQNCRTAYQIPLMTFPIAAVLDGDSGRKVYLLEFTSTAVGRPSNAVEGKTSRTRRQ
jgi:hypothetical protein